jgi:MSHA biogenesis protein MshQ
VRVLIAAVFCLAGCDRVFGLDRPSPGVVLEGFDQRKPIRIVSEALTPLTNFPVALIVDGDPELMAGVKDGRDFAVTDATGKRLDIELERFDPNTGDLVLWARVPELAADGETLVVLYFGGEPQDVTDAGTWSDEYGAVWHLAGADRREQDSTRNRILIEGDPTAPVPATGIAGGARMFDGNSNRMQAVDAEPLDAGVASFSNTLWVFSDRSVTEYDMALNKGGASASVPGYDYELGTGDWQAQVADGDTRIILKLSEAPLNGGWHHLGTVVDRAAGVARSYLDGIMITELPLVDFGSMSNDSVFRIGGHVLLAGRIDEVRLRHDALSSDWIATEHRNLRSPETFLFVGDAEALR